MNDNPTAAELFEEADRLLAITPLAAARGHISFHVGGSVARAATVTVYTSASYQTSETFAAPTWREAIAMAEIGIAAYFAKRDAGLVRLMATAIIEITYDCDECSREALVGHGFTGAEVDRVAGDACRMAGDMSSRGLFVVSGLLITETV